MIYITGAGCGDFSLLTLKAKHVIEQADCILYDRLVDPQILSFAKKSCECIYVGKENHHHTMPQEEINRLLVEKGKIYTMVVRLKGGDPFVFGRGSEEAIFIQESGLPFEVIPGIPSAIGGSGAAGIPVTHRGVANGVRIMSAHSKEDMLAELDFVSMAHTSDTLVFLMGRSNLKEIVCGLLAAGKPRDTKIALVSHAASYEQCSVQATLSTILHQDLHNITPPTLIIVGDVVKLQDMLSIQKDKVLSGKCYAMATLTFDESLLWQFEEAGAKLEIVRCGHRRVYQHAMDDIDVMSYTHILFTSRQAIDMFFDGWMAKGHDVRSLAQHTLCAIGEKSARHLLTYGCRADIVSEVADSEHFVQCLQKQLQPSDRVLLPKADNHNHVIVANLSNFCHVDVLPLYQLVPDSIHIMEHSLDGILFTCSFCVHVLMKEIKNWSNILTKPMYAMGAHTAKTLREYGCRHIIELQEADKNRFIEAIIKEETSHVSR